MINPNNNVILNYKIDEKDISFEIYISPKQECCIVGRLDNNYICWCSITTIVERKTNTEIFNNVLNPNQKMISSMSKVLGTRYREVMSWHMLRINKRIYKNEYHYYSPASGAFFVNNENNFGDNFSSEVSTFYNLELSKCEYRLIDNNYIIILEKYKTLLTKKSDYKYYYEMIPIISILNNESYIKLCPNEGIRNLYLDCIKECSNLYNRYMSVAR
ncbi:hypothetical protein [Clostridium lacusfryxellense]|uniref:hypothetical protein n=1 Tax=Clostridium lacusfryxellense TaxID=205328 RepID=UPI001FE373AE|nr:hypothetical protein [Clostridium lacusfryxellense]